MKLTDTEWYYDKKLDKSSLDRIESVLVQPVLNWIDSKEAALRAHLERRPEEKMAGMAEASSFDLDDKKLFVLLLILLHRDDPGPYQCQIYVGSKEFIIRNKDSIQNQFTESMQQPGAKGLMTEQNWDIPE